MLLSPRLRLAAAAVAPAPPPPSQRPAHSARFFCLPSGCLIYPVFHCSCCCCRRRRRFRHCTTVADTATVSLLPPYPLPLRRRQSPSKSRSASPSTVYAIVPCRRRRRFRHRPTVSTTASLPPPITMQGPLRIAVHCCRHLCLPPPLSLLPLSHCRRQCLASAAIFVALVL